MEFVESFMQFRFCDEDVFMIEKDPLVTVPDGVKSVECVVLMSNRIALIEAKSSTPNSTNKEKFDEFIADIREKFSTSLRLFSEIHSHGHGEEAFERLPIHLRELQLEEGQYAIYLIVHGHQESWMGGLQDALREALRDVIEQWNIDDVNVKAFNHTMAKELCLIVDYIPLEVLPSIKVPEDDTEQHRKNAVEWFEKGRYSKC